MSSWTMILCEGAHDQAALALLACVCGGWKVEDNAPRSLPDRLSKGFPVPKRNSAGRLLFEWQPVYLRKADRYLEVRPRGGMGNVFKATATALLKQLKPDAVGVVVDADDDGVSARLQAFCDTYGRLYGHANFARAGKVLDGKPRIGLWVAPNNRSPGRMEDVLVTAAARTHEKLIATGKRFATSLKKLELGKWCDHRHRNKAILGAVNQVVLPGASLARALQESKCWFDEDTIDLPPLRDLLWFVERLAAE